jgi:diacylglycerol kinase
MKSREKISKHTISFKHAAAGLWYSFRTQPNLKVHIASALVVIFVGYMYQITIIEWLFLLWAIILVMVAELINTTIESMVDLISKDYSLEAKIAKDVSAGMVLLAATGAVIIGIVVFLPYLID